MDMFVKQLSVFIENREGRLEQGNRSAEGGEHQHPVAEHG